MVVRTRLAEPAATSGPASAIPRYRDRAAECRTRSVFFLALEQVQVTGGGSMQLRKSGMLALAIVAILAAAAPARAQITTGNITGTVNDSQGGVIPGATVVLKSETRGTQIAPVVTNEAGQLRLRQRDAGRLHHRDHDGFLQDRAAHQRARERRRPRRCADDRPRGRRRGRDGERQRRSAARAVAERGAVLRGVERTDREPAGQPAELHEPDSVRARRRRRRSTRVSRAWAGSPRTT